MTTFLKHCRAGALALSCMTLISAAAAEAPVAGAKGETVADPIAEKILLQLRSKFPDVPVVAAQPSGDMPGWYEVLTGDEIVYADAAAQRLIVGKLVDVVTRTDLTARRWSELNHIDFASLPLDHAIVVKRGDGSRKLAIFSDPFCPFCEQQERALRDITDITIYTFLYPLESLHPGATDAARDIWCAPDRVTAWTTWMIDRKAPTLKVCEGVPIDALAQLGRKLRINSTPTLFFADGGRFAGALAADELRQRLAR